jgi:hypothetical protein
MAIDWIPIYMRFFKRASVEVCSPDFASVKDNKPLKSGHRSWFWCSQDTARKKKAKPSQNPNAKHCDNVGMKRYPCESHLLITCRQNKTGLHVVINLKHHVKHVLYVDVGMPPEGQQMIEEQAEWLTPAMIAAKIQSIYPQITTKQIYTAWRELSQAHWRRNDVQLQSAQMLLAEYSDDVDIFELVDLPVGVEMLAWGMKHIAEPLRGWVVKIAIDATCGWTLLRMNQF